MNIEYPPSNIQPPVGGRRHGRIGCSLLNVVCWIFLFLIFEALTGFAQSNTNTLPALFPPYDEMTLPFWERHPVIIFGGGAVCVAFISFICWWLLRSRPQSFPPPAATAGLALTPLISRPEDGALLGEVSGILRRYLSATFNIAACELTTTELSAALADEAMIGPQAAETISSLLRACDKDKFAPKTKVPPLNAAVRALHLVEQIESRLAPAGGTPSRAGAKADRSPAASPHPPPAQ
jgi:hypothetical protein